MHLFAILSLFALCAGSMAQPGWVQGVPTTTRSPIQIGSHRADEEPLSTASQRSDEALKNVSSAAAATKMDVHTLRLDDAAQSAERVKAAATEAEKKQAISREDATQIKKAADKVQEAAAIGDKAAVMEKVEKMNDKIDNAVVAKKGPEVAEKLQRADATENKPVLSTQEDVKLLRAAVEKVVAADPLIPADKKQAATNFTVGMIAAGFQTANTTNKQLITAVEMQAAKNKTATDLDDEDWRRCCSERWELEHGCTEWKHRRCREPGHRFERNAQYYDSSAYDSSAGYAAPAYDTSAGYGGPGYDSAGIGGYNPAYGYGNGYDQCLYWSPYSYCQGNLFGDYAFHHGFHHFFHDHGHNGGNNGGHNGGHNGGGKGGGGKGRR